MSLEAFTTHLESNMKISIIFAWLVEIDLDVVSRWHSRAPAVRQSCATVICFRAARKHEIRTKRTVEVNLSTVTEAHNESFY